MKLLHLFLLSIVLSLTGCASGTALVTGVQREPITPERVKIYIEEPANYEVIAIIKATSDMGLTDQQSQDYALEELKKQAAKVGANGILLTNVGTEKETYVGSTYVPLATGGGYVMPYGGTQDTASLSGKAIYVISE